MRKREKIKRSPTRRREFCFSRSATRVHPYAVYIPTTNTKRDRSGEDSPIRIEDLLKISNGMSLNLCDPQFGMKPAGIGEALAGKVEKMIYLTRPPDPATIVVSCGTQVLPNEKQNG